MRKQVDEARNFAEESLCTLGKRLDEDVLPALEQLRSDVRVEAELREAGCRKGEDDLEAVREKADKARAVAEESFCTLSRRLSEDVLPALESLRADIRLG